VANIHVAGHFQGPTDGSESNVEYTALPEGCDEAKHRHNQAKVALAHAVPENPTHPDDPHSTHADCEIFHAYSGLSAVTSAYTIETVALHQVSGHATTTPIHPTNTLTNDRRIRAPPTRLS